MSCHRVHQPPPHPLLDLLMNSCFRTCFHSSFLENLKMSSRWFASHLFLLRHPEFEVSWPQADLNLGWIWWLGHNSKSYNTDLLWPGKVMSCPTPLAGGPIVIFSILARLAILPWGNCNTYSMSCSWWILRVSKVWPLLEDHVNAISKHVYGTPIFNKNIWSTMLNFLYQLS